MKVAKFSILNEKSYNKAIIDFNIGRHKDLPTLKSDIHLGLARMNYHFSGRQILMSISLNSINKIKSIALPCQVGLRPYTVMADYSGPSGILGSDRKQNTA